MRTPYRVLVVDDSALNRVLLGRLVEGIEGVEVVGYASGGEDGLRKAIDLRPDLVTLDLEMPGMGGLRMLQVLMQNRPTAVIVVSSQDSPQNVLQALDLGAIDFIAKPCGPMNNRLASIEAELMEKISALQQARLNSSEKAEHEVRVAEIRGLADASARLVAIASSTGGPAALQTLFSAIREVPDAAFVVAQHMPPGFTRSLAARLNDCSPLTIYEAEDGDPVRAGTVLLCPGGKNLLLEQNGDQIVVRVVSPPKSQIYTPSADALFASAAALYGPDLLAVVLTGMGNDGAAGVVQVFASGGRILCESRQSCVVFGMPKEAIATGHAEAVVPLQQMWGEIERRCDMRGRKQSPPSVPSD